MSLLILASSIVKKHLTLSGWLEQTYLGMEMSTAMALKCPYTRKMRDGKKNQISSPESIEYYNDHVGVIDTADIMACLYYLNKKSKKQLKGIFFDFFSLFV